MISYELRPQVRRSGKVRLVPHSELAAHTGFRSIYGFDETTAAIIRDANSTAGLDELPVYGHELLIDFDNQDRAAFELADRLRGRQIGFQRFHSGGRSIHFHIETQPLTGIDLPWRQKSWILENAPLADKSIYIKTGMFRLEGTYHVNYPGQCKKLLETYDGRPLTLPEAKPQPVRLSTISSRGCEEAALWVSKMGMIEIEAGTTGRNLHAFTLIKRCLEAGYSAVEAEERAAKWNADMCRPPLPEFEVLNLVRKVYA